MDYRTQLIRLIDKFNVESVEEFKEAENLIVRDSKFSSITKKKDYDGHMQILKRVKTKAQKLDPKSVQIPEEDMETQELRRAFEKCLVIFSGVCDSYTQMQKALKDKSEGEKLKYSQFKQYNDRVRFARASLNEHMHELDILYSDFVEFSQDDEEEDFGGVEYKTYDSFL